MLVFLFSSFNWWKKVEAGRGKEGWLWFVWLCSLVFSMPAASNTAHRFCQVSHHSVDRCECEKHCKAAVRRRQFSLLRCLDSIQLAYAVSLCWPQEDLLLKQITAHLHADHDIWKQHRQIVEINFQMHCLKSDWIKSRFAQNDYFYLWIHALNSAHVDFH